MKRIQFLFYDAQTSGGLLIAVHEKLSQLINQLKSHNSLSHAVIGKITEKIRFNYYKLMQKIIYLDNQATTPIDPKVLKSMQPYMSESFGNPASSNHILGWQADEAVEIAREQISKCINSNLMKLYLQVVQQNLSI